MGAKEDPFTCRIKSARMKTLDYYRQRKNASYCVTSLGRPQQENRQVSERKKIASSLCVCMYEHTSSPIPQSEGPIHDS